MNLVTDRSQAPARYQEQDRLLRREGGYVLIWSLFAFLLLGALAAAVLKSTGSERRLAKASSEWNASSSALAILNLVPTYSGSGVYRMRSPRPLRCITTAHSMLGTRRL